MPVLTTAVLALDTPITDSATLSAALLPEFAKNVAIAFGVGGAGVAAGFGVQALWVARRNGKKAMNGI